MDVVARAWRSPRVGWHSDQRAAAGFLGQRRRPAGVDDELHRPGAGKTLGERVAELVEDVAAVGRVAYQRVGPAGWIGATVRLGAGARMLLAAGLAWADEGQRECPVRLADLAHRRITTSRAADFCSHGLSGGASGIPGGGLLCREGMSLRRACRTILLIGELDAEIAGAARFPGGEHRRAVGGGLLSPTGSSHLLVNGQRAVPTVLAVEIALLIDRIGVQIGQLAHERAEKLALGIPVITNALFVNDSVAILEDLYDQRLHVG